MPRKHSLAVLLLLVLLFAGTSAKGTDRDLKKKKKTKTKHKKHKKHKTHKSVLRWVSSGGGWRAMAASMGFANVFKQAGLIDDSEASKFSAMSFNSGSAWFATQFFLLTKLF